MGKRKEKKTNYGIPSNNSIRVIMMEHIMACGPRRVDIPGGGGETVLDGRGKKKKKKKKNHNTEDCNFFLFLYSLQVSSGTRKMCECECGCGCECECGCGCRCGSCWRTVLSRAGDCV